MIPEKPRIKGFKYYDIDDIEFVTETKLIQQDKSHKETINLSDDKRQQSVGELIKDSFSDKPPSAGSITLAMLDRIPEAPKHHQDEDLEDINILSLKKNKNQT